MCYYYHIINGIIIGTRTILLTYFQYLFTFSLLASSAGSYQYDSKAFLFSLVNKPGWAPVKLSQTGKHSSDKAYSIYSSYGPTFGGGHDINIKSDASSNSNSYSNLGHTYSPPSGYSYHSTSHKHSWQELTSSHQTKLKPFTKQPS